MGVAVSGLVRTTGVCCDGQVSPAVPTVNGGILHPYRRLWASERKHMPDIDVAAAGGWKDSRALKLSYQQADPATVLKVVSLESA